MKYMATDIANHKNSSAENSGANLKSAAFLAMADPRHVWKSALPVNGSSIVRRWIEIMWGIKERRSDKKIFRETSEAPGKRCSDY